MNFINKLSLEISILKLKMLGKKIKLKIARLISKKWRKMKRRREIKREKGQNKII